MPFKSIHIIMLTICNNSETNKKTYTLKEYRDNTIYILISMMVIGFVLLFIKEVFLRKLMMKTEICIVKNKNPCFLDLQPQLVSMTKDPQELSQICSYI